MAGGAQAAQPFGQDVGVGAPVQRDDRQLLDVEPLQPRPQNLALGAVQFDLDPVDQVVHFGVPEAGVVLPGPGVLRARHLVGAQRGARHAFGRGQPGEHGSTCELALGHGLAEEHPRRLVADARLDTDLAPHRLQHLFDQLPAPVAGGGHQLEGEPLAGGVVADAVLDPGPAGVVEQRPGRLRAIGVGRCFGIVNPVERADRGIGDRLAPGEQALAQCLAVERQDQRLANPFVGEDRVVEVEVQVLVDQPGLVGDVVARAVTLLEGQRLVDGDAELAGDHVDGAGQQVRFQGRGVLDHPHRDFVEGRFGAPPGVVARQHDVGAGDQLDHLVGSEGEARVGRVGVEGGAVAVGRRVGLEDRPLDVRGQDFQARGGEVEGDAVEVQREGLVVDHLDRKDAPEGFEVADPGLGVAADLPGEHHVGAGHRLAVAPPRPGMDLVGDRDALFAVGQRLRHRQAVLDGRQLGAQHADQPPVLVVGGERTPGHGQHVGLGQHGVDQRVEGRGKLGDADAQLGGQGGPQAGQDQDQGAEQAHKARNHGVPPMPRLTNRVHPTRGRRSRRPARPPVKDRERKKEGGPGGPVGAAILPREVQGDLARGRNLWLYAAVCGTGRMPRIMRVM